MSLKCRTFRKALLLAVLALGISGLQVAAAAQAPPSAAPQQGAIAVPAGTVVTVRMIDAIDSSKNHAGDEFSATVASPIVVDNQVVIPKDSAATVRLVEAKSAGHIKGRSELSLELVRMTINGADYNVESSVNEKSGNSRGKRSAEMIGGGAGLGALIGAVAGGGKGAAIGAGVGAAAGTGAQLVTHGQQVKVPSETKLDFVLKNALTMNQ
jgi:outer membrane lipoprotein SlyB